MTISIGSLERTHATLLLWHAKETHLAAWQNGVAVLGVQVDSKGRAHEARRVGVCLHAVARLGRH